MALAVNNNSNASRDVVADERTPLIGNGAPSEVQESNPVPTANDHDPAKHQDEDEPMPLFQVLVLCYARFVEPVAFFSIIPYINQMVKANSDLTKEQVATYSGLIESLFSLTQMLLMLQYGRAADYFGRKPVLVFSLAGLTVTCTIFGLAKTIWQMILFRCLSGCFAGVVLTCRTMLAEVCTKKTQARAFSIFSVVSNVGISVGPLIGGILADPARQYPGSVFNRVPFFHDYPYAMPSFAVGVIALSAFLVELCFAKETLRQKTADKSETNVSTLDLIRDPDVAKVLGLQAGTAIIGLSFTALAPSYLYVPVKSGGVGFDERHISYWIALCGLAQAGWMIFGFTPLQRRFSTGIIYRTALRVWPLVLTGYPLLNVLLRLGWTPAFYVLLWPGLCILGSGVAMAYAAAQLTINDIAPTPNSLGTLNGVALSMGSGIRAVAPAGINSIFSLGVQKQIIWGYLAWAVLIAISLVVAVSTSCLPEKAEGDLKKQAANKPAVQDAEGARDDRA